MNLRDFHYLVAVDKYRHFGKAANACFVSQPTLSMQLKKLEQQLGVSLIERNNKRVLITEVGAIIVEHAKQIISEISQIKETAQAAINPYQGKLSIGLIPTLAPYLLPHIMPQLTQQFPDLTLHLIEEKTANIIQLLKNGELDTAILALPINEPGLVNTPLFNESFLLATANNHPLAQLKQIDAAQLQNQALLLLEEGHCLRDQALEICAQLQATEQRTFHATSLETLRYMVASGVGITLIPELAAHETPNLRYIPITKPNLSRSIGMLWRKSTPQMKLLDKIAKLIKTHFADSIAIP